MISSFGLLLSCGSGTCFFTNVRLIELKDNKVNDEVKFEFPFEFEYAVEKVPLGTGGGIKLAMSKATSGDVVVLNGDTFFDVNLSEMMKKHNQYPSSVTLALKSMRDFDRYGRV